MVKAHTFNQTEQLVSAYGKTANVSPGLTPLQILNLPLAASELIWLNHGHQFGSLVFAVCREPLETKTDC